MHAARMEFLTHKYNPTKDRDNKHRPIKQTHPRSHHDDSPPLIHDDTRDHTSLPEDRRAYPYGRYVTYKGETYEMAPVGTEPRLIDIEDAYDEAEIALTKGAWLQRLGRKSE